MTFDLKKSLEILERTPAVLETQLAHLDSQWTSKNEGDGTWSVYDVVGHLIHGEKTDWIVRASIILSANTDKTFQPFDRFAMLRNATPQSLELLIMEFKSLRKQNLEWLTSKTLSPSDFEKTGIHPELGIVTLSQLLSCWVVHDLNHLAQINRIMAHQYADEVGPWTAYLSILHKKT